MSNWSASLFATAIEALIKRPRSSDSKIGTVTGSILRYPVKTVAAFIMAPFLAFRVARSASNPVRRAIATIGLFLAVLAAWFAGTLLGTATAALLIATKIGLLWGVAFFVGTTFSVILSVTFSILALNATALLFLHMSSEEVVAYLRSISD